MRILIQKFGGTSVATAQMRSFAADKITAAKKSGYSPVVVVSAMGRRGEPYATDTLLHAAREAAGAQLSLREADMLMACGEIISAVVMATLLEGQGYRASALTGWQAGIHTNHEFGNALSTQVISTRIEELLERGVIPVVAGFQGITTTGEITTLGRGGSDTTAAILGCALRAELIEIYTDVDGVMTADPAILPEARVLSDITYNDVFQMADHGAKVIHPRAVEIAMRGNVPLVVRNTRNDTPGTRISSQVQPNEHAGEDVVSSVAHIKGRAQFVLHNPRSGTEVLSALAQAGISIDVINIFPQTMAFTIDEPLSEQAEALLGTMGGELSVIHDCCKVSAIGSRMRGVPGVMARILRALVNEGIEVLQSADSHTTISCIVRGEAMQRAVAALHKEFKLA